jgi:gliding motility-associated-like protein
MKNLLTAVALVFSLNAMSQDVYIPNAFSPNGDGRNDIFIPVFNDTLKIEDYNLEIYDRFGVQIFQSRNPSIGWDGLPFDTTYVYRFYMKCKGYNEPIVKSGSITLIN